jgi:HAD superfamily hydrolase (TIGR01509 family)
MPALKAVLFDMGDTLFERDGGSQGIVAAARALGAEVDPGAAARVWAEIQARARTPEELAKGRDLSPAAHRAAWTALYQPAEVFAPGLAEALYEREISAEHWRPYPDTVPTLAALRERGVPVGVVSDAGFDVRRFFQHHGVDGLVDAFVISFEEGATKPAPVLFTRACERLGVTPAEALMVGDNWRSDGGAVDAGLTCLLLPATPPGQPHGLDRVLSLVG